MNISLVGMSGSGKSHWSKKLEKKGFRRFSIDELLEEKLEKGLKQLGYSGINDVSKWMRQPYEERYVRTSATYLEYEKRTMLEVLRHIETDRNYDNIVIDTTGSVVYTGDEILDKLSGLTKVIYLETPASVQKEMYELYIKDPKPVIWGDSFNKKAKESNNEALARCYPELLAYRTKRYEKIADKTLDYSQLRNKSLTLDKFLLLLGEG